MHVYIDTHAAVRRVSPTRTNVPFTILRAAYHRAYQRWADRLAPWWGRNLPDARYMRAKGGEQDIAGYLTQVAMRMLGWLNELQVLFAEEVELGWRRQASRQASQEKHARRHPRRVAKRYIGRVLHSR